MTELWFVTSLPVAHQPGRIWRRKRHDRLRGKHKMRKLTNNVLVRVDTAVQLEHLMSVAQLSLHLVIVLFVGHTEAVCHLHDALVGGS